VRTLIALALNLAATRPRLFDRALHWLEPNWTKT